MYGIIKEYIETNGDEFKMNPIAEDLFITLALNIDAILRNNVSDGSYDRRKVIDDTYHLVYPMFRPLMKTIKSLSDELEKQMKYGTRITVTKEQFDNLEKTLKG